MVLGTVVVENPDMEAVLFADRGKRRWPRLMISISATVA